MTSLAPIVLFVYNRPIHTRKTIEALQLNNLAKESDLIIFSDAAKDEKMLKEVNEVRDFIRTISGFKSIKIIERDINFGLVKSIREGVTEIVNQFDEVIVLEDDLICHPQFLEYMNNALRLYKNNKRVFTVTGYSHLRPKSSSFINNTCFLKITCTWSWATWSDRWVFFNDNTDDIDTLDIDSNRIKEFNYDNSYPYYKMLKNRSNGKIKSWGVVWYWSVFKLGGLTLYPSETLIDQIGFDGSGENSRDYKVSSNYIKNTNYKFDFPCEIEEQKSDRLKVKKVLERRKLDIIIRILTSRLRVFFQKRK